MGISIRRNFPLTLIERSYGVPFGRFRSDSVRLVSDPEELHGYKWAYKRMKLFSKQMRLPTSTSQVDEQNQVRLPNVPTT